MSEFGPRRLFQELRRRRVFNTAALFVVGAWVALQVTELALPGLNIPDFAIRYVWIGTFALFPLVLVFGWLYDISAGGIRRTAPAKAPPDADTSLHRADHWIIGGLATVAVVIIVVMLVRIGRVEPEVLAAPVENSIAVLPFEVCEKRVRDAELAGGLTIEVINRLAERGRLKVIARASSAALAGIGLPRQQIAGPLGVEYLLSAELCRQDNALTLAAELFDAQGFIVWSERFEQGVNQWDQVTERLATLVASGVAAQLGDVSPAPADAPVNRRAYEQLLIGTEHFYNRDDERARAAFERALEYDPDYPEAAFHLALLDTEAYLFEGRAKSLAMARPRLEDALAMARRRLEEDQRSADNHFVLARVLRVLTSMDEELAFRWDRAADLDQEEIASLKAEFDAGYAEAERHFRAAITLNPSRTDGYGRLADVIERQGVERRAEALEVLEAGQVRDPFNVFYNWLVAKRWAARGRYRQAVELLDRFKDLPETPPLAWWGQLELMTLQGYWDEKAETLVDMLLNDPGAFDDWGNRWQVWWFVSQLAELGLYEEAEAWKVRIENMPMWGWARESGLHNYLVATGRYPEAVDEGDPFSLFRAGRYPEAIALLETRRHQRNLWHERELRDDLLLASLYREARREAEAASLLEESTAYLEAEFDAGIRHWETLYHLAEAYAMQGRDDEALDMLRKSVDYNGLFRCAWFDELTLAAWEHLRQDPRFIRLCERGEAELDQQAERVRTLLAGHDTDELLEPLMALAAEDSGSE